MRGIRQASTDGKKRKLCGKYNSKLGCKEPCPNNQLHGCNIIKSNNKVCEDRRHSAFSCPHVGR